jgi:hypothetical protein
LLLVPFFYRQHALAAVKKSIKFFSVYARQSVRTNSPSKRQFVGYRGDDPPSKASGFGGQHLDMLATATFVRATLHTSLPSSLEDM